MRTVRSEKGSAMNENEAKEIKASNGREIDFAAVRQSVDDLREYEAK